MLGKGQFGFRRGKGTRDAVGMLRIISERILGLDEVCLRDRRQKAFDSVSCTKLSAYAKGNWY